MYTCRKLKKSLKIIACYSISHFGSNQSVGIHRKGWKLGAIRIDSERLRKATFQIRKFCSNTTKWYGFIKSSRAVKYRFNVIIQSMTICMICLADRLHRPQSQISTVWWWCSVLCGIWRVSKITSCWIQGKRSKRNVIDSNGIACTQK